MSDEAPELVLVRQLDTDEGDHDQAEAIVAYLYRSFTGRPYRVSLDLSGEIGLVARAVAARRQGY